jgi:hypothetical protein
MDRKNRHLMRFPNDFENLGVEEQKVRIFFSPMQYCGSGMIYSGSGSGSYNAQRSLDPQNWIWLRRIGSGFESAP